MTVVILAFLPDASVLRPGSPATRGIRAASLPRLAFRGAECLSDPPYEVISSVSVAMESGRWAELDGMPTNAWALASGASTLSWESRDPSTISGTSEDGDRWAELDGMPSRSSA
jgi:hypothetical protein